MIIPKSLEIEDFLSFEHQVLEFKKGKTICVMGKNLTEDNQESNGSGKSAFQSAVEFTITGGISRKINKSKIVRWGCSESKIKLDLIDSVTNETISINRIIPIKGSEKLSITVNGKPIEFPSVRDGNDWVEQRIGISRQDISSYFIVNEVNYISFFNSPDSKKKELISRFSNADIIDNVFIRVQSDIDKITADIVSQEKEILRCESKIETLQEELQKELDKDFEKEKQESINTFNERINRCNDNISSYKVELKDLRGKVAELIDIIIPEKNLSLNVLNDKVQKFISSNLTGEFEKLNSEMDSIKLKLAKVEQAEEDLNRDKREIDRDITTMKYVLDGKIECPNCHHNFNPKSGISIEEAEKKISEYSEELEDIKSDFEKIKSLRDEYDSKRKTVSYNTNELLNLEKEEQRKRRELEGEIAAITSSMDRYSRELKSIERSIKDKESDIAYERDLITKYEENIEEIKNSKKSRQREFELAEKIGEQKVQLEVLNNELSELEDKESSTKSWIVNFKLFKSYLANKKLRVIQDMINHYLDEMGCDYKLKLEGYKQLSSGDLREKITPYIYKNGDMCDYGEFSKGERARIDFATLITMQTLVNDTRDHGGLDLLMCDEIMEGLDSKGLNSILKSFGRTGKTAFMTTHVVNDQLYDDILIVEKINGISKIKN